MAPGEGGGASGGASAGAASGGGGASGASTAGAGGAAPSGSSSQSGAQAGASGAQAAANAGAGAQTGGSAGAASADWTSSFNEETRGYIQNKGWKDQSQVLDSYRNLEKLVGAPPESILKIPKEGAEDAASVMEGIYTRLGRPATPEEYKLEIPKENGSPEFAKMASEQFHQLGLSAKQGQELAKWWNGYQQNAMTAGKEAYTAKVTQEQTALRKEWGAAHEQNTAIAKRAAREFGVKADVIDALEAKIGFHETMKFFHTIGSRLGEATFHSGQPGSASGVMTPAQAKAKISALKGDPEFVRSYTAGSSGAREQMESLHKMAYPDVS